MLLIHGGDTHSRLHYLTQVIPLRGKSRVKTDQIGLKLESDCGHERCYSFTEQNVALSKTKELIEATAAL